LRANEVAMTEAPSASPRQPRPYAGLIRSFCLFVLLPTLVGGIYFGLLASDRYVAEARYAIRTGTQAPAGGFLENVLGAGTFGSGSREDAGIVRDYILSHDMLNEIEKRIDIRAHYGAPEVDWLSRLPAGASDEDLLEYFQDRVEVIIDSQSNISTLRVRAFDRETARTIARHLLALSERLVNEMSERISEDTLRFARGELDRTEGQVRQAISALTRFRKESRSIDPGQETTAVLSIITELETRLAGTRAELIEARSVMRDKTPQIQTLESRAAALASQVVEERDRLANSHSTDLTSLIDRYQPLVLEQELSKQRYVSALSTLEAAQAEAQRQQRYLIAFVAPQLPDKATEPRRAWMVATVFAFALLIFGIGGLLWSAVKDHVGL
jgi:capsular polysaccharide transport system permease protein